MRLCSLAYICTIDLFSTLSDSDHVRLSNGRDSCEEARSVGSTPLVGETDRTDHSLALATLSVVELLPVMQAQAQAPA